MNTAKRKLEGKIAVITGGNSGIGRATAQLFNQEGARIALIGRDQTSIDETLAELSGENLGFKGDVTSAKDLNGFFDQVRSRFGKIDILFINAGIAEQSMIADTSPEFYDRHFNINVRGAFFAVQKAFPCCKRALRSWRQLRWSATSVAQDRRCTAQPRRPCARWFNV